MQVWNELGNNFIPPLDILVIKRSMLQVVQVKTLDGLGHARSLPISSLKVLKFFLTFSYLIISLYKKTVLPTFVPVSLFHPRTANQSPPNFAQTYPPTLKRSLTQVWPRQLDPLSTGYPKLWNLNGSQEKILFFTKKWIKFYPGSTGPRFSK